MSTSRVLKGERKDDEERVKEEGWEMAAAVNRARVR